MKSQNSAIACALMVMASLTGCGEQEVHVLQATDLTARSGNLRLLAQANVPTSSGVAHIKYTISGCPGTSPAYSANWVATLSPNMRLPGGLEEFEDKPLDANSRHMFADHFRVLRPGCYDVVAEPVDVLGQPVTACTVAQKKGLTVTEGATTETMLLVQCKTAPNKGAADVVTTINRSPQLTTVEFKHPTNAGGLDEGRKFACGFENRVCIAAKDPDNDPIRMELQASIDGDAEACMVEALDQSFGNPGEGRCFFFVCDSAGRVDLKATVLDLTRNSAGELIPFEEYFENLGPPRKSRSELTFMSYFGGALDCDEYCRDLSNHDLARSLGFDCKQQQP